MTTTFQIRNEPLLVELQQNHMATTVSLTISCLEARVPEADRVLMECHQKIAEFEVQASEFNPQSPIYQLNHAGAGKRVALSDEVFALFLASVALKDQTASLFDPAIKSVIRSSDTDPWQYLEWDPITRTLTKTHPGVRLSFGAIGKGFILDRIRTVIEQAGFNDYLLDAGGSSLVIKGFEAPGVPWEWAWTWLKKDDPHFRGFRMSHQSGQAIAIGVSGLSDQGQHILSNAASTSLQSNHHLSTLIACPSATKADALSTAAFQVNFDHALTAFSSQERLPGLAVVQRDEKPRVNGVFARLWGIP